MFDKIITVNELEIFQHCRLEKKMKVRTVNMNRKELIEKRSINTKVFENQDHSCTAEIYLAPVHYKDTDGTWKEMDNKLEESYETSVYAQKQILFQKKVSQTGRELLGHFSPKKHQKII